ncbi:MULTISPECIES: formylglycine-generating enzyme family protein [Dyadobacter]|uniref:Formylglycine-generating enzyme family protein n=1 Tax=Dyadobacter chenhuakuii TaxID=2909339 RepID=A0A9X1TVE0_9BACT|nr:MULTISPECIES: formylglycine-generating enzyme family protein [Dyadobacter]MCE7068904.1 formylglycine-generating enzyme family protein [Dyadobacter sp. CY327]MCF2495558.1 formylglycine-generating enzyme family protein [Dyadobacter chenhuakuii]MCF2499972.1 formylglycine-generating enzyme family protein [Dyadobacter chenhuakuii]MCF2520213.1 formylglycine-generating enzyme family protein [Dyadobacter sp. CY351]USJ29594.1 formylglycine-generating enzyme family protein [Dyadobacter chenhuakuii]
MSKQFLFLFSTVFICFTAAAQDPNFKNYTQKIGGSPQVYDMVAIPGGEFMMGSPDSEKGRRPDEGPQHKVKIEPFWMGKTEVNWDIYDLYAFKNMEKEMAARHPDPDKSVQKTDASTRPSPPYVDMSFGMGRSGYPAINMTQYAAIHFCKWLYEKTGVFYRLPTEAEWEYACRAGSKTAYSFGADESKLDEYAWHRKNSDAAYKKIGLKKPNAFGLHDMHGNVMEWTLDQYIPDYYAKQPAGEKYAPVTELYPTAVRGGSWDDEPADLRSAARTASKPEWKILDPQLPKSEWWMTSASFVGFRVVRPLKQPSQEEINAYYSPKLIEDY